MLGSHVSLSLTLGMMLRFVAVHFCVPAVVLVPQAVQLAAALAVALAAAALAATLAAAPAATLDGAEPFVLDFRYNNHGRQTFASLCIPLLHLEEQMCADTLRRGLFGLKSSDSV